MIDKDIVSAAQMYLDGNSLRKVAKAFGVSHVTVYEKFLNRLPHLNHLLASEVNDALKDNAPMSIKNSEVVDRVLKSYHLFVNNHLSIMEISKMLNVSFFTTYRDLDRRLYLMYEAFPEFVTKEMVDNVKKLMTSHRLSNLTPGSNAYHTEKRENGRFSK